MGASLVNGKDLKKPVEKKQKIIIGHTVERDYLLVFILLIFVILISWIYIFNLSNSAGSMNEMSMAQSNRWVLSDFIAAFAMWSVMMNAMMLPSAMPMILIFSTVNKKRQESGSSFVRTWIFVLGYVIIWISFSFGSSLLQFFMRNLSLISDQLKLINPFASGIVLVVAGIYQFTPLKDICLKNCQSPLGFVLRFWKEGKAGAILMGIIHGIYCIGCCWFLMILLFVGGIMNLLLIFVIALFVFLEKIIKTKYLSRAAGILLILAGIAIILHFW